MNEYEEKLLRLLYFGTDEATLMRIVKDPNVTIRVLKKVIDKASGGSVLVAVLNSPLLNEELIRDVFSKNNIEIDNNRVWIELIKSPLLTEDIYQYILDNKNSYGIRFALVNCKYTSEETCLKILDYYTDTTTRFGDEVIDMIKEILNSPYMSSAILDKMIDKGTTDELMMQYLQSQFLTPAQYEKIVNIIANSDFVKNYRNSSSEIFKNKYLDSTILCKIIDVNIRLINRNGGTILQSPLCDKTVLIKLLENTKYLFLINEIINHQAADKEVLLKALEVINIIKTKEEPSNIKETLMVILKNPLCDDIVIREIIKADSSPEIINEIKSLPNISKEVRIAIMATKKNITLSDINEILEVPGINEDDYNYLLTVLPMRKFLPKLIEKDGLSNELYIKIIPELRKMSESTKTSSSSSSLYGTVDFLQPEIDYISILLEKELSEYVLCEIAKTETKIENIRIIGNQKSAGINLSSVLRIVADRFNEKERDEINTIADNIKRKVLRDVFVIEEEDNVTEILRTNIEDGLSTMLWGPSGVGKSSRVFEIDPTTTMLILKNGMLPEEVIGGKEPNGEPGKIYPPHWYIVLCEKCKKEPDKQHVLFIDEFTNVSDTIKNLVWEVIGNRLVNGHEEWPLPDNCSIVVAGNRPEESSAVRIDSSGGVMPAPLHNRIDSMLEIQFDIDEWQKWALETDPKTNKLRIHPIVYSYCVAHAKEVMFSNYNPDDVTQPFLSPRKWETLSKAIYKAEERGELHHISDTRIKSIIGNTEIAEAFIAHYERLPLDMDRIERGDYQPEDFPSVEDKLYALGIIIAKYNGDEMAIESFIVECLGEEYYSIYKSMKNLNESVLEQGNALH